MSTVRAGVPDDILRLYEVHEWRNALAILKSVHPNEWKDILEVLRGFRLSRSEVVAGGGNKTTMAQAIDAGFLARGWKETKFETRVRVEEQVERDKTEKRRKGNPETKYIKIGEMEYESPTHWIDCYKNSVALELEWNNKDPFFDRDLNNFRLLFDLRVIHVGVMITRCDELQEIFKSLGIGASYGSNTTRMGQLLPRIEGGGGGGCPVLVLGMKRELYVED